MAARAWAEALEGRVLLSAAAASGLTLVKDIFPPGAAGESPRGLTESNGRLFFLAGNGLWTSNGTGPGTFDLSSSPLHEPIQGAAWYPTDVGGTLYFSTGIPAGGGPLAPAALWRTDGTPAGTVRIAAVEGSGLAPGPVTAVGDTLYFSANGGDGFELWKSDGTQAGTALVRTINPDFSYGSNPAQMFAYNGKLLFTAEDGENGHGRELWVSDGTAAGTRMLKDINPLGRLPSNPDGFTLFNGMVYFSADDNLHGTEMWRTDGTEAGTVMVADIDPAFARGSIPSSFTELGGRLLFRAASSQGPGGTAGPGTELWSTDGTAEGTRLLKDLEPGPDGADPVHLTRVGDRVFFLARTAGPSRGLWRTDGTADGTVRVAACDTNPADLTNVAGTLFFWTRNATNQFFLYRSDGTPAGTAVVGDLRIDSPNLTAVGSTLFLTAYTPETGKELYKVETRSDFPPPTAEAGGPYAVGEGQAVALHGFASNDWPQPLTFAWDLDGDGLFGETGAAAARGDETGTDVTLRAAGLDGPSTYTVRLRISDPTGYAHTDTADVAVRNAPPAFNLAGGPAVLAEGNPYTLTLSASDPGLDTIAQWVVDWGDGATETLPGYATSAAHVFAAGLGTYGVSVTASDEDGVYRADRPAALDGGFGAGGKVTSTIGQIDNRPVQLALQPDGKILALSSIQNSSLANDTKILITRYNPDGTLDPTFGGGGRVVFDATPNGESPTSLALQPDGRIVVAGALYRSFTPSDLGAVLLRLLPDGSLDPSFGGAAAGGGLGWATYQLGSYEAFGRIKVAPDGHIVAGGIADQKLILFRFTPNGALDPGFGTGGEVVTNVAANGGGVNDMALLPDGKILVVPFGYPPTPGFLVMRFNADGSPDNTFGDGGRATGGFDSSAATSLAPAADGSFLVASPGGVVARCTPAGALDATFGDHGRIASAGMSLAVVRVLPDGRILLAGTDQVTHEYLVDRYLPDGSADAGFGAGGRFRVNLGSSGNGAYLRDLAVQPDGALLLYGGAGTAFSPSEALVRLTPPGLSVRVVDAAKPVVSLVAPPTADEGSAYTLGLGATDPDGDGIVEWFINWGDGAVQVVGGGATSATHTYADGPRTVFIKAVARDGDGSLTSAAASVTVNNVPPAITVTAGPPVAEGSPYTVQFGAADVGPDTVTGWGINWGDGKTSSLAAGSTSATHTYTDDGVYAVTVSATDEDGTFAAAPVNATVTNVPPTLDPLADRVAAAGAAFQFSFVGRDVVPEFFAGMVDWGDGSQPTPFSAAGATSASPFSVGHAYAARGTYTVTVNLSDGDGGTATRTAVVRVGDVVVRVFEDKDGNGFRDAADPARVGATAFLDLDRDGAIDLGEPVGTTDAFGDVLFDGLPAGASAARVVVPPGWHLSAPAAGGFIDVTPGTASAFATFGLSQATRVTGVVFNDANANGVRDPGEGPLSLTVRARRVDNGSSVTTGPDADGVFRFVGLLPGQYVIEFPNATRVVTAPAGGRRGRLVTLTGEQADVGGLDLGTIAGPGATLSGTIYRDTNGNGTRDAGEPGVFNQIVYLDANNNGVRDPDEWSAASNNSGAWSIPLLPAGTYRVRQVLPPGAPAAKDQAAWGEVTVGVGQSVTSVNLARPYERVYYVRRFISTIEVYLGSESGSQGLFASFPASNTTAYALTGTSADDWFILDWTSGSPMPAGGIRLDGLGGAGDTVSVIGTAGADAATFVAGGISLGGTANVSHASVERVTFDGRGGWDAVAVTGGPAVTFAGGQFFQSLDITAGASAALDAEIGGAARGLVTRGLGVPVGANLDLADGYLIVDYAAGAPSPADAVRSAVARGYNGGAWNGVGIRSTAAANNPTPAAVGFAEAADLFGGFPADFSGYALDDSAVLLRYVPGADANLDRTVNDADYAVLQAHFGQTAGRYSQADFNFDGVVDSADRDLLFAQFGRTLLPTPGSASGRVFDDVNGNGASDAGEPGLAGVTVFLDVNGNGALDANEPARATDMLGRYAFDALGPGVYAVRQVVPAGLRQTAPAAGAAHAVTLVAGGAQAAARDFADVPPARVFVAGQSWSAAYLAQLAALGLGDAAYGFRVPPPGTAPAVLPWLNVDRLSVRFAGPVTGLDAADLRLRGGRVPNYTLAGFTYDPDTFTATWTLAQPIGLDRLLLELPAAAGLDLTAAGPWPGLTLPFNVVPGDAFDRNGTVGAVDTLGTKARQGSSLAASPANYSVWFDVDGNGRVEAVDTLSVKAKQGTSINSVPGEPALAAFADTRIAAAVLGLSDDDELAKLLR